MNNEKIHRIVQSIGKTAFIEYFDFLNDSSMTKQGKVEILMRQYDYNGATMRVSFFSQLAVNKEYIILALKIIENSSRIDKDIRLRAREHRSTLEQINKLTF